MSGHNGFIAVGNGNPPVNPIVVGNVGGVQPPANPNPPVAPPGGQPPQAAPEPVRTGDLARQLDVLLLQAGKLSAKGIDADAVKAQLRAAKIPKGEVKALNALIDKAARTMAALDKFTGRAIGMATVRDVEGYQTWNRQTPEGQAIEAAINAQAELSEKMRSLINEEGVSAKAKGVLEATAMTCDRRACELETLVIQFAEALTDIRSQADLKKLDPAILARLDMKVFALMGEKAASMHGHAEALDHMRAQLAPLAKRIDGFAANPDKNIASPDFAAMRQEFAEAKTALATLARDGYKVGEGRVHPDSAFLDAAKAILAQVEQRMSGARQRLAQAAFASYMDSTFAPPPSLKILDPKFRPLLKIIYPQAARLVAAKDAVHAAARTYAKDPTDANLDALKDAIVAYNANPMRVAAEEIAENLRTAALGFAHTDDDVRAASIEKKKSKLTPEERRAITPELIKEFGAAAAKYTTGDDSVNAFGAFYKNRSFYTTQLAHFEDMRKTVERMGDEDFLSSKTFLSAFEGELAPSTLVEARVHGMQDDDVDPATDPSNVEKAHPLGKGNVNTVTAVVFKTGQIRLFKPEAPGRDMLEHAPYVFEGYTRNQQMAQLNLATQKTADVLGLGDVVVKTTVGKHDGQYGIFMTKAPGNAVHSFANNHEPSPGSLNASGVQLLSTEEHARIQGRLMRKCNRLDWLDAITGQGDRHNANVFVDVRQNGGVDVTGIDNDTCYPAHRIGLDKYVVRGHHLDRFNDLIDEVASLYGSKNAEEAKKRLLADPGVTKNGDGSYTLDSGKFQSPELNYCLMYTFGMYSNHVPNYIDKDLYEHLQALKSGPDRDAYLADLKTRLSPGAYDAAVKRLDEAIARADALQAKHRVLDEDAWNDRDMQKTIYNDPAEKPPVLGPELRLALRRKPRTGQLVQTGIVQMTQGNYRRNGFDYSAKRGWFA